MPVYAKKARGRSQDGRCWTVVIHFHGQRKDFTCWGTKAEAEAFEARERVKLEVTPATSLRVVPKLAAFCADQYRPHAELHLGEDTWEKRRSLLVELVTRLGHLKLNDIQGPEVDRYAKARLGDGLKPVSVNNELRVLRRVLNFARELGVPLPPPRFALLKDPGAGRVKVWNDEQVTQLLASCGSVSASILPLVLFLLNTGCRKGEALALSWDHVDLDRKLFLIWPGNGWSPKNGKPREVPIADVLLPFLKGKRASEQWVFPSANGDRFACWPKRQFDRARKAAGLQGGPHTCRHTFASHFLKNQPDLFLLAQVMGHSDIAVTKLYSHLLPEHLERARNVVSFGSPIGAAEWTAGLVWGTGRNA